MEIYYVATLYYNEDNYKCFSRNGGFYSKKENAQAECDKINARIQLRLDEKYENDLAEVKLCQRKHDTLVTAGLESPRTWPQPYKRELENTPGYSVVGTEDVI